MQLSATDDSLYAISSEEIERRKEWLFLTAEDEHLIREIKPLLQKHLDELIDSMYSHFLAFDKTRSFFPDEDTLHRAQQAQRQYFLRLVEGNYDVDYVKERIKVGLTHYRIGLDPKWYLGAYQRVLNWFRAAVSEHYKDDDKKCRAVMAALQKVVYFDMGIAIDSYMDAKEAAIKKQRDILAELETERRVTKSILEDAPIGIFRVDRDFICLDCNREFLEIIDRDSRDAVIGKSIFDSVPYLPKEPFHQILATGQPYRSSAQPLNLDMVPKSTMSYWDWVVWPEKNDAGETTGIIATFAGATDRVLLQQQREDFVATLTHDLKTPIIAANRAIKLILEGDFGQVSESQSSVLETISQSNEALYKMVQTLLDVYRYDSGAKKLSIQEHDLSKTVASMVEELKPLAHNKEIEVIANLPQSKLEIRCDPGEIRRVIQNLLDNSLKFTPKGGTIEISLTQEDSVTTVLVKDTGKGISAEDKPKLFQRFWQAAASSGRYYASTGLGLYLCRKIVDLHGGTIWCESTPGEGSTFGFTIDSRNIR